MNFFKRFLREIHMESTKKGQGEVGKEKSITADAPETSMDPMPLPILQQLKAFTPCNHRYNDIIHCNTKVPQCIIPISVGPQSHHVFGLHHQYPFSRYPDHDGAIGNTGAGVVYTYRMYALYIPACAVTGGRAGASITLPHCQPIIALPLFNHSATVVPSDRSI